MSMNDLAAAVRCEHRRREEQRERDRFIRLSETLSICGVSKSQLYQLMARGEFPAVIKQGRSSRWSEAAVYQWVQDCKAAAARAAAR